MRDKIKAGLVLAGGGARGAYQLGVLNYLSEIGFVPDIIAGTSIGALNGAVLSSYKPFSYAVSQLNTLWDEIGHSNILRINPRTTIKALNDIAHVFSYKLNDWLVDFFVKQGVLEKSGNAIFDITPIDQLLRNVINPSSLREGIELWATVFPSLRIPEIDYQWIITGLIDVFRAYTGVKSHWFHVQDCKDDETIYKLLLASAAIPFAFPKQDVNGCHYVDGGLADNIPLGALAQQGCTHAIVIHLSNGNIWSRHDFPNQIVIEVRPQKPIIKSNIPGIGWIHSVIDFRSERIIELKENGYADAQYYIGQINGFIDSFHNQRKIHNDLINSTIRLLNDPLI